MTEQIVLIVLGFLLGSSAWNVFLAFADKATIEKYLDWLDGLDGLDGLHADDE